MIAGMNRRDFITLLGGAAAWPLAARAQQASKIWRMGFIARGHETFYDALFESLGKLGYAEGRNLIVERRYAGDRTERFQEFAAEMVRLNVDIIIVVTTPAALAIKRATTTIPVVFPNAINPVESGRQPGASRRQCYGRRGSDCRTQRKASGDTQGSSA
jgi:putative ABC transport system substrate-binding protein